jgi:hypothetical protein
MGLLARFRAWIWRAEEASNELEYTALEGVHHAEDALDKATGGRFYHAVERVDEEAEELLERLHLDEDEDEDQGEVGNEPEKREER